jgi:CxxC motif-containing protein (DUF1111 family)
VNHSAGGCGGDLPSQPPARFTDHEGDPVSAAAPPPSGLTSDGLGPLYNAQCCQRCHLREGRGHPPEPGADNAVLMVLRVSVPAPDIAVMTAVEACLAEIGAPT